MDLGDKVTGTEIVISEIATMEPIAISEIATVEPLAIATPEMFSTEIQFTRSCVECGATKTPLWRGGPAGPKSLCNACGIRGRKKKKALLGFNKDDKKMKKSGGIKKNQSCTSSSGESTNNNNVGGGGGPPGSVSIHWTELGEVEQAAFMLMSLSCGSVYA